MNKALRSALYGAATGLVLALFGGILGAVSFGTIVLRMLFSALLAAILGAGSYLIIQKYLPELLTVFSPGVHTDEVTGTESEAVATGENVNIVVDDDMLPLDLESELSSLGGDDPLMSEQAGAGVDGEGEKALPATNAVAQEFELPAIQGFSDTFLSTMAPEMGGANYPGPRSTPSRASRIDGDSEDPKVIARALRTMLAKE